MAALARRSSHTSSVASISAVLFPPACRRSAPRWRRARSVSSTAVAARRSNEANASSSKPRRADGPPWTTARSSGEKTVTGTAAARSARRARWRLTWARDSSGPRVSSVSTVTSRPASLSSPRTYPRSQPPRIIASRGAPRNDRCEPRNATASRTVVLPLPFGPDNTVVPSVAGSTVAPAKRRKSVIESCVRTSAASIGWCDSGSGSTGAAHDTRTGINRYR